MGRLLLAGALLIGALAPAYAGPTRKVEISGSPEGASVYLNDVDSAPVCEPTPCSFNAPVGSSLIIIKKVGFEPDMQELEVTKGKKPLAKKYELESLAGPDGTIKVDGPKGAEVRIDRIAQGKAPISVELPAGEHHVSVVANGKSVFDDHVEVQAGKPYVVKAKTSGVSTATVASNDTATVNDDDDDDDSGGGGGGGGGSGGSISSGLGEDDTDKAKPSRGKIVSVGIAFDAVRRDVTYGGMVMTLRELGAGGQGLVGPAIEVWPGRILRVHPLRGLSLFARYQVTPIAQIVVPRAGSMGLMGLVSSRWNSLEISLRQRFDFSSFGIEGSVGYVADQFRFAASQTDYESMPAADYRSIRIGIKASYAADGFEPYLSAENRIVMYGGALETRFPDKSEPSGVRAAFGFAVKFGPIAGRVEGSITRYSWVLDNSSMPSSKWQATSATDLLLGGSLVLGYTF